MPYTRISQILSVQTGAVHCLKCVVSIALDVAQASLTVLEAASLSQAAVDNYSKSIFLANVMRLSRINDQSMPNSNLSTGLKEMDLVER
jgi:hypothetical protein